MDLIRHFEQQMITASRPYLQAGDVVRVETKVQEGGKTRLQAFEGTILGIRGSGPSATFTVRRETGHFGVERIFPLHSPLIENIVIVRRQKVRRAKLTYLRERGRRRFKEDVKAMQRYLKDEEDKKRLAALRQAQAEEAAEKRRLAEQEAATEEPQKKDDAVKQDEPKAEAAEEKAQDISEVTTPGGESGTGKKEREPGKAGAQ